MNRLDLVIDWVARAREARYRAEYLASRSLVSASHLRGYFKQTYGRPPQDWLDELRIWHAVELVCAGLTVKEVAAKLDFGGPSHLAIAFEIITVARRAIARCCFSEESRLLLSAESKAMRSSLPGKLPSAAYACELMQRDSIVLEKTANSVMPPRFPSP